MIKRRFYKEDHGDNNGDSATSSSSSDDDSHSSSQQTEQEQHEVVEEEVEEKPVATREAKDERYWSQYPGSGYESEDSSGNAVDCDSSGFPINEDEENIEHDWQILKSGRGTDKNSAGVAYEEGSNVAAKVFSYKDPTLADSANCILKCKSVFKCKLCPRIVCLSEDTLKAHLMSKRHARSKKLLSEGRLKLMLNSDGEIEEEQETHAERHARTMTTSEDVVAKPRKNKGRQRQRQRQRARKKKMDKGSKEERVHDGSTNKPKKKRHKAND